MGLLVGLLGGAIAAALKMLQSRTARTPATAPAPWVPIPEPQPVVVPPKAPTPPVERPSVSIADLQEAPTAPPEPAAPAQTPAAPAQTPTKRPAAKKSEPAPKKAAKPKLDPWVEPVDGTCPPTHPVKAKMSSKIYHLPGGLNYARTRPDRCYVDAAAAEDDGLRPSKR